MKVSGLTPALCVWRLHVLPVPAHDFSVYSAFLPHTKHVLIRLIGAAGVSASVNGCLTALAQ